MRTFQIWTLSLAALAVWISPALPAEPERLVPEEGAVQVMLLRHKSVRDELKLTEDETRKIHDFTEAQWKKAHRIHELAPEERHRQFEQMSQENDRFLDQVLEPSERKRLNQITIQVAGLLWVTRPEVASELKLTEDQKAKARALQLEARKEMQDLLHSKGSEGQREKLRELRATSRKRLMELLTDEQETKWKELAGEPFRGELRFQPLNDGEAVPK